jgi:hypothetical protein
MKRQKEEQIEKKIAELFEKKESVKQITELHNSEMGLLKDNPSKLRILYKFYDKQLWKMHNKGNNELLNLYKTLREETKEFAVKNYNFNEISVFFNN